MNTDEVVKSFSDIRIPTSEELNQQQLADTALPEQTENAVDPQLEEATQLAELAAQTATEQATQAQTIQAELEATKQALAEREKLISEMSMQNELAKFQEFIEPTPPIRPTKNRLEDEMYMSQEEIDADFDRQMTEYDTQMNEYYTVKLPEYQNTLKNKEDLERKSIYSTLGSEIPDIMEMQSKIETMISKNPYLQSLKGDDQIINAYIMVKGVDNLNKPTEKPPQEKYEEMLKDDNFKAFYEQQRLEKAKEQSEVPPMGKGGDTSLNIPKKPTTFGEIIQKYRK
jgi:hypothetical protein